MRAIIRLSGVRGAPGGVYRVRVLRGVVKVVRRCRGNRWVETVYVAPGTTAVVYLVTRDVKRKVLIVGGRVASGPSHDAD